LNDIIVSARATNKAARYIKVSLKLKTRLRGVQAKIENDLKKLDILAKSLPKGNAIERSIRKARSELKRALEKSKRADARLAKRCQRNSLKK